MNKKFGAALVGLLLFTSVYLLKPSHSIPLPTPEAPIKIYSTREIAPLYTSAIKTSNSSLHLFMYNLKEPAIINGLKRKGLEGLKVVVIHDAKMCKPLGGFLASPIECISRRVTGIMHKKILVIDEDKTLIGSANMTKESLQEHQNLVVGFHHAPLAQMIIEKTRYKQKIPHRVFQIANQNVEMWFIPDDPEASKRICDLIDSAKKTIRVAMFAFTNMDLAESLIKAKQKGVSVTVYLDQSSAVGMGKNVMTRFLKESFPLFISKQGTCLHNKMMVVDEETLVSGSLNWTNKGFGQNEECFLVLHSLNDEQRNDLDRAWSDIAHICQKPLL